MYKDLIVYSSCYNPPVHPPIPVQSCPFCGGNASASSWAVPTISVDNDEIFSAAVFCHDCAASVKNSTKAVDELDYFDRDAVVMNAIQRWNTRI